MKRKITEKNKMPQRFCAYHNYGLGEFGPPPEAEIHCEECRALGLFTPEQIQEYEKKHCHLVAIYRRPLGDPESLLVVLRDTDTEDYARFICPLGSWKFESLTRREPTAIYEKNLLTVERPEDGRTLEDSRKTWDFAPPYCY